RVEALPADPVGEGFQGERPVAQPRDQVRRDLRVVADEIRLRVAVLGPEHLLEVRELDPPALDLEHGGHPRGRRGAVARGRLHRGLLRGVLRLLRRFDALLAGADLLIYGGSQASTPGMSKRAASW